MRRELFSGVKGTGSLALGHSSIALGNETYIYSDNSVGLGSEIQALKDGAMAMGYKSYAGGTGSIAIGRRTFANVELTDKDDTDTLNNKEDEMFVV